jgi:hypothetical protein
MLMPVPPVISPVGLVISAAIVAAELIKKKVSTKNISVLETDKTREQEFRNELQKEFENKHIAVINNKICLFQEEWRIDYPPVSIDCNYDEYEKEVLSLLDTYEHNIPQSINETTQRKKSIESEIGKIRHVRRNLNTILEEL